MDDRELMQMALDALKSCTEDESCDGDMVLWYDEDKVEDARKALRERLAQPEPKPYNPMENNADYERGFIDGRQDQMRSSVDKAINRMASREWVGLESDEQILEISKDAWGKDKLNRGRDDHRPFYIDFARAIEAKLREKNNG
jgi:hypothetical protein